MTKGTEARYVVDGEGQPVAVILELIEYNRLLEAVEELEAIQAYDEAKDSGDEALPFEDAIVEIESQRSL